jgi:heme/copper-type cytochrome/quinol oxidase subunit 3
VIPYTCDRRADTGVTNVTMGVWLFLASEVMLFGSLFSAYALLRTGADIWPAGREVLQVGIGAANTVVLVAISAAVWRARASAGRGAQQWLGVAIGLALLFLALKSLEYQREIAIGLLPSVNTFLATYFLLTGVHALHVAGGAIANVWALTGLRRAGPVMTAGRVRGLALYWAFVDAVWLLIFGLVYLS